MIRGVNRESMNFFQRTLTPTHHTLRDIRSNDFKNNTKKLAIIV